MDIINEFVASISWDTVISAILHILIVLVVARVALALFLKFLHHLEERMIEKNRVEGEPPSDVAKRVETLFRLVRQAVRIVLWTLVALIVLQNMGVEIGPILAGAGILGLAVGFGAQNLVRDVISGFFFILEDQIRVGDVAIINGTGGLVERVNLRTIVLRDLAGTVHVFPNGTVSTLSNMTHTWSAWVFDIGVAYKEDTDRVVEIIKDVGRKMREDPELGPAIIEDLEIFGVNKFADSAVEIKGRIKTRPIQQWTVGREFQRRIKYAFDEQGIEIPFPHRTVYFGEASKPFDLRMFDKAGDALAPEKTGG
ncbi:MAG TPA: mechanosensitive ion channel family protein [Desulfuromonadales bacterium]|nr:mechanosensitive ion channel family protein [Desulfuromonadales bacterium]